MTRQELDGGKERKKERKKRRLKKKISVFLVLVYLSTDLIADTDLKLGLEGSTEIIIIL